MKIEGFDRSTEQCRLKVKRLRGEYKKIRDSNRSTGESRKYWKHFDVLDDILGSKPSTRPLIVVDTLADRDETVSDDQNVEGQSIDVEDKVGEREISSAERSSATVSLECGEDKQAVKKEIIAGKKKGKKGMSRDDRLENAIHTVMEKMKERQNKTDYIKK